MDPKESINPLVNLCQKNRPARETDRRDVEGQAEEGHVSRFVKVFNESAREMLPKIDISVEGGRRMEEFKLWTSKTVPETTVGGGRVSFRQSSLICGGVDLDQHPTLTSKEGSLLSSWQTTRRALLTCGSTHPGNRGRIEASSSKVALDRLPTSPKKLTRTNSDPKVLLQGQDDEENDEDEDIPSYSPGELKQRLLQGGVCGAFDMGPGRTLPSRGSASVGGPGTGGHHRPSNSSLGDQASAFGNESSGATRTAQKPLTLTRTPGLDRPGFVKQKSLSRTLSASAIRIKKKRSFWDSEKVDKK